MTLPEKKLDWCAMTDLPPRALPGAREDVAYVDIITSCKVSLTNLG